MNFIPAARYRNWWGDKLTEYPHVASASTKAVKPHELSEDDFGPFVSVGSSLAGIRLYAFKSYYARERFFEKYWAFGARFCF